MKQYVNIWFENYLPSSKTVTTTPLPVKPMDHARTTCKSSFWVLSKSLLSIFNKFKGKNE